MIISMKDIINASVGQSLAEVNNRTWRNERFMEKYGRIPPENVYVEPTPVEPELKSPGDFIMLGINKVLDFLTPIK